MPEEIGKDEEGRRGITHYLYVAVDEWVREGIMLRSCMTSKAAGTGRRRSAEAGTGQPRQGGWPKEQPPIT